MLLQAVLFAGLTLYVRADLHGGCADGSGEGSCGSTDDSGVAGNYWITDMDEVENQVLTRSLCSLQMLS